MVKSAGLLEVEQRWGEVKSQVPSVEVRCGDSGGVGGANGALGGQEGVFLTHQYSAEMIPAMIIG